MSSHFQQILAHFERSAQALSLHELARELDIEPGTLQGMIDYLVRKGKLREMIGTSSNCHLCTVQTGCPFIIHLPRYYEVAGDNPPQVSACGPACSCGK